MPRATRSRAKFKKAELPRCAKEARVLLAVNLRLRRAELGLSQERAAERADFSLQYLQRIERRIVNVPLDTVARLAHALGVEPRDLLAPVGSAVDRPGRAKRALT